MGLPPDILLVTCSMPGRSSPSMESWMDFGMESLESDPLSLWYGSDSIPEAGGLMEDGRDAAEILVTWEREGRRERERERERGRKERVYKHQKLI